MGMDGVDVDDCNKNNNNDCINNNNNSKISYVDPVEMNAALENPAEYLNKASKSAIIEFFNGEFRDIHLALTMPNVVLVKVTSLFL
jgi:hypothetical protein